MAFIRWHNNVVQETKKSFPDEIMKVWRRHVEEEDLSSIVCGVGVALSLLACGSGRNFLFVVLLSERVTGGCVLLQSEAMEEAGYV